MSRKLSVILICIVIVISLGISIYIPNRNKIQEVEDTSINYKTVEVDNKIGVIEGEKTIIEPQYDDIIIVNPHRAVFTCQIGDTQKIVNENNKEIFTEYNNVEPIEIVENKYERNIFKYEKQLSKTDEYFIDNLLDKLVNTRNKFSHSIHLFLIV